MKRQIILRGILGIPVGITIGYLIAIVISFIWAEGYYAPCAPDLVEAMGNEINGVILQTLLSGLLGAGFAAGSVIWEIESWSIVKQTAVYFGIVSVIMMPTAYCLYWMEHSIRGFISYFGIFALIFAVIWAIEFVIGRCMVKRMNAGLSRMKKGEERVEDE